MKTPVRILMCGDNFYAPHVATALLSIRDHCNETPIEVFFGATSFSDEHRVRVQSAIPDLPITWIDVPQSWLDTIPKSKWPAEHFARLYAIEHLPADIDRVLYLDADILVRDDLSTLWSTDLNGATIGAVRGGAGLWMAKFQWNYEQLGLDGNLMYVNSGLMLIDLDAWRARSAFTRCMNYIETWSSRMQFADQEVINAVFSAEWIELAPRWNWIHLGSASNDAHRACAFTRADLEEARTNPAIVHYAGPKPWHWKMPRRDILLWLDLWEQYAFSGPYRNWYESEREQGLATRAGIRPQKSSPFHRFKKAASVLLHG